MAEEEEGEEGGEEELGLVEDGEGEGVEVLVGDLEEAVLHRVDGGGEGGGRERREGEPPPASSSSRASEQQQQRRTERLGRLAGEHQRGHDDVAAHEALRQQRLRPVLQAQQHQVHPHLLLHLQSRSLSLLPSPIQIQSLPPLPL